MKTFQAILLVTGLLTVQCKSSQVSKASPSFENTHWRLSEVNGNPIITLEGSRDVYIMMTAEQGENRITGFAGCNNLGGGYSLSGEKVKFTTITTKMMCAPEQMAIEDFLLKALTAATSFKISGDELELIDGQVALANFKAVPK